jgi:lipopolysaccharide transport system permease protein
MVAAQYRAADGKLFLTMSVHDNLKAPHTSNLRELINPVRLAHDIAGGVRLILANRNLIVAMASRELKSRYAGQITGSFWIVGHPLFQLLLFVFIFGVVFKQRIGGSYELPRDYTTYMLSGLVPWLSFSSLLTTACNSVIGNANLVKQFTFKTELLPVKDVAISMIFWTVGITILIVYGLAFNHELPWTYVLLPILLGLHLMFAIGVAWILSSVSVFVRDMKDVITVLTTAGIYVLPIVYLPQWVPAAFRPLINLNPFSALVWVYQDTLYFGRIEHPFAWVFFSAMTLALFGLGYRVFGRLRAQFGSVL